MKKINSLFVVLVAIILITSCGKDGAVGPQGDAGDKGANGAAGPQGPKGNANVLMYTFGSRTFKTRSYYEIKNISKGKIDSSLVLVYYSTSDQSETSWYPVQGLGPGGRYQTDFYISQTSVTPSNYRVLITLSEPNGILIYLPTVTFTKVRIIIAPVSTISATAAIAPFNRNNYNAVKQYYHLSD